MKLTGNATAASLPPRRNTLLADELVPGARTRNWHWNFNDSRKTRTMKAKIFEVVLHKLPSGKSPATAMEEQLNQFLAQHPDLELVTTHMSTLVSPAEPNAMPRTEESSIIIFCTLFYTDLRTGGYAT